MVLAAGAAELAAASWFRGLNRLAISDNELGLAGISALSVVDWRCLQDLDLANNRLCATAAAHLVAAKLPGLLKLNLYGNNPI